MNRSKEPDVVPQTSIATPQVNGAISDVCADLCDARATAAMSSTAVCAHAVKDGAGSDGGTDDGCDEGADDGGDDGAGTEALDLGGCKIVKNGNGTPAPAACWTPATEAASANGSCQYPTDRIVVTAAVRFTVGAAAFPSKNPPKLVWHASSSTKVSTCVGEIAAGLSLLCRCCGTSVAVGGAGGIFCAVETTNVPNACAQCRF